MMARGFLRRVVSELGARTPSSVLGGFDSVLNHFHTARWMRDSGYFPKIRAANRLDLIRKVAAQIADEEVLYLEFGVWKGESITEWSRLLRNSASRLHGFDSFEGLPEEWNHRAGEAFGLEKGHFSTQGNIPKVSDPRIKFYRGWFEETLPGYTFIESPTLVIFLDADLYSSTIYVLRTLKPHIKVGTIIYFDEFWDPMHEQRALKEFVAETGIELEAIAADNGFNHVAFRRVR